jgi:trk system potassium uptake protein TrkA
MKIVIVDGSHAADYIIKSFKKRSNKLIVINSRKETVNYLVKANHIPVFYGEPYKVSVLENAHIEDCDLFISLGFRDTDNFVACLLAKKVFRAKKCICIVSNPKNVEIYRQLGIDSVVSSTHVLAATIVSESSLENLTKSMSLENDKVALTEIVVKDNALICDKKLMDINFPKSGTISCIYRKPSVIIPNGKTVIKGGDKLFVFSSPNNRKEIIDYIHAEEEEEVKK